MDQPSGSNMKMNIDDVDDDVPGTSINPRKRIYSGDIIELVNRPEIKINNENYFGSNLRSIVAECESRIRRYVKRQRLDQSETIRGYDLANADEDSSNSSSVSLNGSNENIVIDPLEESVNIVPRAVIRRQIRRERSTIGQWLFLSFVNGGWSYENMKNYLMKEYGVKCLRSKIKSERNTTDEDYKAIVKFNTSEELNRVVISLNDRKMNDKFVFLSFDKKPLVYYDSDSSDDDDSFEPLIPMPKGI